MSLINIEFGGMEQTDSEIKKVIYPCKKHDHIFSYTAFLLCDIAKLTKT